MTAATPGIRLRFLGFFGPQKPPATVTFGPGQCHITSGWKIFHRRNHRLHARQQAALRDIPERVGYDLILLGLETLDGKAFTLWQRMDGGGFRLYEDLHRAPPYGRCSVQAA
ncbi:MAG: hypothetical protein LC114_06290 [Bryobacterales bacterium]|nr:hypothetical protein [Bryobacterales bacterium]